jgi:hypothetical protein
VTPLLADGGTPADRAIQTLYIGAVLFGGVAFLRLRNRGFLGLPKLVGWLAAVAAVGCLAAAFILPPIISPQPSAVRPSTSARISIVSPRPGQTFRGDPAEVPVTLHLEGGKIVPFTSTKLLPDTGHIHVYLDGALIQMTTSLHGRVGVVAGRHTLRAEFVAVDHAPFNPGVVDSVTFVVAAT